MSATFISVRVSGYVVRVRRSNIVSYMIEKDKSVYVDFKKKVIGVGNGWLVRADDLAILDKGV